MQQAVETETNSLETHYSLLKFVPLVRAYLEMQICIFRQAQTTCSLLSNAQVHSWFQTDRGEGDSQ